MSIAKYSRDILRIAVEQGTVTGHDVQRPAGVHCNRLGPVWAGHHRRGLLFPSGGSVRSENPSRRRSFTEVWRVADPDRVRQVLAEHSHEESASEPGLFDDIDDGTGGDA